MKDCPYFIIYQERIIQEYEFFNVVRDLIQFSKTFFDKSLKIVDVLN